MKRKQITKLKKRERELILTALLIRDNELRSQILETFDMYDAYPTENCTNEEKQFIKGRMQHALDIADYTLPEKPDLNEYPNYYSDFVNEVIKEYNQDRFLPF
jgi:hypothetical protein